ncbi:BTB domain-containing protein [Trichonephila clavata]|uniref:BTB domain-containing protein n=1 Tax=Trichonephila clavata TaxID=2740835 RepID=A0A8X6L525_TRICU|nr:BTB domain-containing protein [Trichonephila clavata]
MLFINVCNLKFQAKKLEKPLITNRKICWPKAKKTRNSTLSPLSLDKSHHARLGQYTANLWKDKVLTDVIIIVQNHEFKTHKAVLACYSPYFADAFVRPGFSDVHYLQLPTVTPRAFAILLEYMYTGQLKVTCQELSDVYRSARKLGMKGAMKECVEVRSFKLCSFNNR